MCRGDDEIRNGHVRDPVKYGDAFCIFEQPLTSRAWELERVKRQHEGAIEELSSLLLSQMALVRHTPWLEVEG